MPPLTITIERFKPIELLTLTVDGLSLLVGGNNSGKSSALQAIQLGVAIAQTSELQKGKWKGDILATSIGQSELIYSPLRNVFLLSRNHKLRTDKSTAITLNYSDGSHSTRITLAKGKNKNVSIELTGESLGKTLQSLDKPFSALVTGLAGIPSTEEYETPYVVRKTAAMGNSNSVFRNILLSVKAIAPQWRTFRDQLGEIFPGYEVEIDFDENKDEAIKCFAKHRGSRFPIDSCGTGLLQTVQILSYLNFFQPSLLLLDEPDSHLHPNNQKNLARVLERISKGGTNVIVASHSRHMVRELMDHSTFYWMRSGSAASRTNMDNYEIDALLDIGALDAGEQLNAPSVIILCEDERHALLKQLVEASGFAGISYEVVGYHGCSSIGTARAVLKALRMSHPSAVYCIHRDRDFLPTEEIEQFQKEFRALDVEVFIPDGNDLESHLVSADHISSTCGLTQEEATSVIETAFTARKASLVAKYVNTLVDQANKKMRSGNAGQYAAEAASLFESRTTAPLHGKTLLNGIRDEFRIRGIRDNLHLAEKTSAVPALASLASMVRSNERKR